MGWLRVVHALYHEGLCHVANIEALLAAGRRHVPRHIDVVSCMCPAVCIVCGKYDLLVERNTSCPECQPKKCPSCTYGTAILRVGGWREGVILARLNNEYSREFDFSMFFDLQACDLLLLLLLLNHREVCHARAIFLVCENICTVFGNCLHREPRG
jgi:hypothetical protein